MKHPLQQIDLGQYGQHHQSKGLILENIQKIAAILMKKMSIV
jgi:hypothetical protein